MSIQYLVVAALAVGFLTNCRSVVYDESEKGVGVYPLAKSTELRSNPQLSDKSPGATVSLAEPLIIQKTAGNWMHVKTPDMGKVGWIHRGAVTYSEEQAKSIKESPYAPANILFITNIISSNRFSIETVVGGMRMSLRLNSDLTLKEWRWVITDGDCLSFDKSVSRLDEILITTADLTQKILRPTPWRLYCYSQKDKQLLPISDMIGAPRAANKVEAKPK